MKRIFIALVAMATMMIGAWSCAEKAPNIGKDLARQSFDAWVEKYAPAAYANRRDDLDVYIEYIEKGPEGGLRPVIGQTWLNINYTGKTLSDNTWEIDPTNGTVFVMRDSLIARRILPLANFNPATHYANDFVFYENYSTKLCEGLIQTIEELRIGDSVRVYIPADKGYSDPGMGMNKGYAVPNVKYTGLPIMFELRLADVVTDAFIWERDSVERYAKQHWKSGFTNDTVGVFMRIEKSNPQGYEIGADSSVSVYYEEYFMDGFLASTNIDTVAQNWNVYNNDPETAPYEPVLIMPSSGERAELHKILYIATPYMRRGEIAEVVTVSTWAQGDVGIPNGTPEILPYQPMRYRIHVVDNNAKEDDDE